MVKSKKKKISKYDQKHSIDGKIENVIKEPGFSKPNATNSKKKLTVEKITTPKELKNIMKKVHKKKK
jgi:hypothetical protein